MRSAFLPAVLVGLCTLGCSLAQVRAVEGAQPGHSRMGEAFNEGPRQRAVLMGGTGDVHLPVTVKGLDAQRFFDQGVGQLHGFWYFEAERSFRQVAAIDPECAMAYWGMAMANVKNAKRARGFIEKATSLKGKASAREGKWIDALAAYYAKPEEEKVKRRKRLVRAYEGLVLAYPDDLEAKAFLVGQVWENSTEGVPVGSYLALDSLAKQVLAANPRHPIHHYRIHLWNNENDSLALDSAAQCGQSAPAIAHLWHMPGHTYSSLRRYADAAWQQEASARVDHAFMQANRLMPEQIHNYAHNNDWLVENLAYIGRVHDAVDLAKNMVELPQLAPRVETDEGKRSSFTMGRGRLLEVTSAWELWDELSALAQGSFLPAGGSAKWELRRATALAVAAFSSGHQSAGEEMYQELRKRLATLRQERAKAAEAAEEKSTTEGKSGPETEKAVGSAWGEKRDAVQNLKAALSEVEFARAIAKNDSAAARKAFTALGKLPVLRRAQMQLQLQDGTEAEKLAQQAVKSAQGQVLPLATLAYAQWQAGRKTEALATMQTLRPLCAQADLDMPALARLQPLAKELGWQADWRPAVTWGTDIGQRPELAQLGPFRWSPMPAPALAAPDQKGQVHSLAEYQGKPVLVMFYLGSGCARCLEQLNLFAPMVKEYEEAGISLVAVSTDSADALHETISQAKEGRFPFPILADPDLSGFKRFRAFDDFEQIPLHGLFLVDGQGLVRWHDVSFEAFRDPQWLLTEAKRLLALPVTSQNRATAQIEKSADVR